MLLLLDTGNSEVLKLEAFWITFRKPSKAEKDFFYEILWRKKADSSYSLFEELKENILVIDYKNNKSPTFTDFRDKENILAFEKFNEEKRKIIYLIYFLFASCDVFENSSFLSNASSIRVIDLYNLDSRLYDQIISETIIEKFVYQEKLWKNLYHFNDIKKQLEIFNILFKEASEQYSDKYFYYIWELIYNYVQTDSLMMRFSILTSIIEFFIVHKGGNTEQFKFKTSLVTNKLRWDYLIQENPLKNSFLPRYQEDISILDEIYDIRSRIVHWDFSNIKIKSKEFLTSFSNLQFFTSSILHQYMLDPAYIEFIKKNW